MIGTHLIIFDGVCISSW